jgi:microcin C transport system substrate-binding protein
LKNPVVDELVEKLIAAKDRKTLVITAKALDRVLLWGEYIIPNWYISYHRTVYWDKFGRPDTEPLYYPRGISWVISAWWKQ